MTRLNAMSVVTSVDSGSAAEKAGLKPGDVITKFGVRDVTAATELTATVQELASGSTATVTFQRGAVQTADVVLG